MTPPPDLPPAGGGVRARLAVELLSALHDSSRWVKDVQRWSLDCNLSGLRVLSLLEQRGAARVTSLAEWDHVDASTMSRAVAGLQESGLVHRSAEAGDGRAHVVDLTDAGRALLADKRAHLGQRLCAALAGWTTEDVEALTRALRRLVNEVDSASPPSAANGHDPSEASAHLPSTSTPTNPTATTELPA